MTPICSLYSTVGTLLHP